MSVSLRCLSYKSDVGIHGHFGGLGSAEAVAKCVRRSKTSATSLQVRVRFSTEGGNMAEKEEIEDGHRRAKVDNILGYDCKEGPRHIGSGKDGAGKIIGGRDTTTPMVIWKTEMLPCGGYQCRCLKLL